MKTPTVDSNSPMQHRVDEHNVGDTPRAESRCASNAEFAKALSLDATHAHRTMQTHLHGPGHSESHLCL